jgi:hypothetical protein
MHCVTTIDDGPTTPFKKTQAIDRKMQYKWREDLLPEEKRARLQEKTDQFLGKVSSAQCTETPMSLLPIVLQEPRWPEGHDTFAQPEP